MPTEEENAVHALTIDQAAGLPIMLYNYPTRMGVMMGEDVLSAASGESKNVVAIKESSGDIGQRAHARRGDFPNIALSCGWDDQALEFFAWGARSWVCAASNFLPAEHIALYEACVRGEGLRQGAGIMAAMMPLMDLLERAASSCRRSSTAASSAGLRAGAPRLPLLPLEADEEQALATIVAALKRNVAGDRGRSMRDLTQDQHEQSEPHGDAARRQAPAGRHRAVRVGGDLAPHPSRPRRSTATSPPTG